MVIDSHCHLHERAFDDVRETLRMALVHDVYGVIGVGCDPATNIRTLVATTAGNRDETFAQLRGLGLPVYAVNPVRLADVFDLIGRLGALTGREAEAARLTTRLTARIDAVKARVSSRPRPRVLYVVWPDPLIVPARRALVSEPHSEALRATLRGAGC